MKFKLSLLYITSLLLAFMTSCRDDFPYNEFEIGEGEAMVKASVYFQNFGKRNLGTRTAGDAIEDINELWIAVYNTNNELVLKKKITDYTEGMQTNRPADGETSAQTQTKKVSFNLDLPYGRYYMYAIGNVDLTNEDISTADDLKSLKFTWNSTNISENDQMFGYFDLGDGSQDPATGLDAPAVIVNKTNVTLHAWIKRLASKVTVDFDGSNLLPGVTVFLKSLTIKDIPEECYLGKNNTPTEMSELITNGEQILYYDPKKYPNWPDGCDFTPGTWPNFISDGHPTLNYDEAESVDVHGEKANALYFYENMQGTGKNKAQDADSNGLIDYPDGNDPSVVDGGFKDEKRFGTYIEVEAYYSSKNAGRPGQGRIIYRFMLGKDVVNDYNAQRNFHYKLTLVLRGYANEADWHIVYEQPPIAAPVPYYISYLYNRKMMCPVEINAGSRTIKSVEAEIVDNPWYPTGGVPSSGGTGGDYYSPMALPGQNPWNGFLSLYQTDTNAITYHKGQTGPKPDSNAPYYLGKDYTAQYIASYNKLHGTSYTYNASFAYPDNPNRGKRQYTDMTNGGHKSSDSSDDDQYYVKKEERYNGDSKENIYFLSLPMYTRARNLIKNTSYTGNNPYSAYMRNATVRLRVKFNDDSMDSVDLTIKQVRRCENPKGVYRSYNKATPFHVRLKALHSATDTKFEDIRSDGGWKAYVVGESKDRSMIQLTGGNSVVGDTVYGKNGTFIDFNINFIGTIPENQKNTTSRHAVVRVEYNNYTCEHLIFCRQGSAPIAILDGKAKWHSFNMRTKTEEASTPLDEGSLFKSGFWDYPIDSKNNQNWGQPWTTPSDQLKAWVSPQPNDFIKNAPSANMIIAGSDKTTGWGDFGTSGGPNTFSNPVTGSRVATLTDWEDLYAEVTKHNGLVQQGYGALYGDGATDTADDILTAFGYNYYREDKEKCGMRGVFVYNKSNGVNVFFPIGQSGYGHRKQTFSSPGNSYHGVLRYSCNNRWGFMESTIVGDRPLFYDIFRRPGAIYWFDKQGSPDQKLFNNDSDVATAVAWDFNYFTFDFYPISWTNVKYDACFVRCVSD